MSAEVSNCVICLECEPKYQNFTCKHKVLCDGCARETFRQRDGAQFVCAICREPIIMLRSEQSLLIGTEESLRCLYALSTRTPVSETENNIYRSLAPAAVKNVLIMLNQMGDKLHNENPMQTIAEVENLLNLINDGEKLTEEQVVVLYDLWQCYEQTKKDFGTDDDSIPID